MYRRNNYDVLLEHLGNQPIDLHTKLKECLGQHYQHSL